MIPQYGVIYFTNTHSSFFTVHYVSPANHNFKTFSLFAIESDKSKACLQLALLCISLAA